MGKKSKATKAAPKRKPVGDWPPTKKQRLSRLQNDDAWKSVFIQGEAFHTAAVANIHRGPEYQNGGHMQWDFSHFVPFLKSLLAEHPGFTLFVFCSPQPFDFDNETRIRIQGTQPMPTLNIILMPQGCVPRPFTTDSLKFTYWDSKPSWAGEDLQGRVSIRRSIFESVREEGKEDVLKESGYDANVLESVKVVKLYPKNPFVTGEHKDQRVNEYYGQAFRVV